MTNTGPVVAPYDITTIFEPSRRLGGDRVRSERFGLGLSIVRAVVRAHGGEVAAVPRDGGAWLSPSAYPGARASLRVLPATALNAAMCSSTLGRSALMVLIQMWVAPTLSHSNASSATASEPWGP